MKRVIEIIVSLFFALLALAPKTAVSTMAQPTPAAAQTVVTTETAETPELKLDRDLVVVYTNDIHCGNEDAMEYAYLAAFVESMKSDGNDVLLVDAGDAVQGEPIATVSKGATIIEIMNKLGYDVAAIGNHEFDYGMEAFMKLSQMAEFAYVSCNFRTVAEEKPVFNGYQMFEFNGVKIAFVGISTPETFTSSTPVYFQDDAGSFLYGFCEDRDGSFLYETVQKTVDAARAEGAKYVIALGHLGIDYSCSPWTSPEVIANTKGIDVLIDGHSHSVVPCTRVKNADGEYVLLTQTGTKLAHAGMLLISKDGNISTGLVDLPAEPDKEVKAFIEEKQAEYAEEMRTAVAHSNYELAINEPGTDVRMVRRAETNLGDLCADAYRIVGEADIGLMNGGGIRVGIRAGDITYKDIIAVLPFGNELCVVEATGEEILQALEMGACAVPNETGAFLQTSGLTYEIHAYIPTPVVKTEQGMFDRLAGENRVKNVLINGEPLDPAKTYSVASHNYMLQNGGDGFNMFMDNRLLKEQAMVDNQMLITFVSERLHGEIGAEYSDPYGQGRITVLEEKPAR